MNSIGPHQFLALHGDPEPLQQQVEVISRPGVEGVALWKRGRRGIQFGLRSVRDCEDLADAMKTLQRYRQQIDEDPVPLTWNALDMTRQKYLVAVLRVRALGSRGRGGVRKILAGVGGFHAAPGALLECEWELIAIGMQPQQ